MKDFIPVALNGTPNYSSVTGAYQEVSENVLIKIDENNQQYVTRRPVFIDTGEYTTTLIAGSPTEFGRGMFTWADGSLTYIVSDDYQPTSGGVVNLAPTGSLINTELLACSAPHTNSGTEYLLIQNAGEGNSVRRGNLFYSASSSAAPTRITDANMPGNNGEILARGVVSLAGYVFLLDINGNIHNSDLNDMTTWTATSFIQRQRKSDIGVYIGAHGGGIVYIGTKSIEFFYLNPNPPAVGSVLSRREDVFYDIGTPYPNTVYQDGDRIYFVGTSKSGVVGVYMLENFQLTKISDNGLDSIATIYTDDEVATWIDSNASFWSGIKPDWFLVPIKHSGTQGILVTMRSSGSYYWTFGSTQWNKWTFGSSPAPSVRGQISSWTFTCPIVSVTPGADVGTFSSNTDGYFQFTNGLIANSVITTTTDSLGFATIDKPRIVFPMWDGGTTAKKRINSLRVINNPLNISGSSFEPIDLTLKWRDLDEPITSSLIDIFYYTVGPTIDISGIGKPVRRLGSTRKRQFVLDSWEGRSMSNVIGLEIDYDILDR